MRKQLKHTSITAAVIGTFMMMSSHVVMAGPLTVPNTFVSGDAATAATVNANFTAVKTEVDDNDTRIGTNTTNIGTNATGISTNATDIGTNSTGISTNATDIGANTTGINTNATDISTNATGISTNNTNIGTNATNISNNTTDIGINTTAIAGHETRIGSLEAGGGGGGGNALPVTVACPSVGAIQAAINGAAANGRLVITIDGTCSENVDVTRDNVTLLGGTLGGILGGNTGPTVSATGVSGLEIENLTVGGGTQAVFIQNGSAIEVTSSNIGDTTTEGAGMVVAMGSLARLFGGTNGNVISGGSITLDDSPGLEAVGHSTIQVKSGINTVNGGAGSSAALTCQLSGSVIVGDFQDAPTLNANGKLDFLENCYLGMFNGTVSSSGSDSFFGHNSTMTLEGYLEDGQSVDFTGNIYIENSSSALISGDTVTITGNVIVHRSSTALVEGGATIAGTVELRNGSGVTAYDAGTSINILDCQANVGGYSDIWPETVVTSYQTNGVASQPDTIACGKYFPPA